MAHQIEKKADGTSSIISTKPTWHELENVKHYDQKITSEQAILESGCNFTVAKTEIKGNLPFLDENQENKSDIVIFPDKYMTYRTDTRKPLGIVGSDYQIMQNERLFKVFDDIIGKTDCFIETAGVLFGGERVFMSAKLPSHFRVGNSDDIIEEYLFGTTAHDGSGATIIAFSPVRPVCWNTLSLALATCKNKVAIRHSASAEERLLKVDEILGIRNLLANELQQIFTSFSKKRITDEQLCKYLKTVMLPAQKEAADGTKLDYSTRAINKLNSILAYAGNHHSQLLETTAGTLWGALNCVSGYFQNIKAYKTADNKVSTIMLKDNTNQKAFNLALELNNTNDDAAFEYVLKSYKA
jgi:phage/plasmid-like protein (TIGR03299 family)